MIKLLGALGIDWKIFLIQTLNFLVLFFVLKWLFFDKFITALKKEEKKENDIKEGEEDIQRKKMEMEKMEKEIIQKAKEKAKEIIEENKEISEEEGKKMLEKTEREIKGILNEAKERGKKEIDIMKEKEEERMLEKTKEVVEKILPQLFTRELHIKFIKEAVERLKKVDLSKIKEQEIISVTVISAFPLTREIRKTLSQFFLKKLKNSAFQEKVDPSLIAGIKIMLGDFVIDNSLKAKIEDEF